MPIFQHYLMHNFQGCQDFNLEVTFRLPQSACRGGGCRGLQAPQEPAAPSRGMQASLCPPCPPGAWAGVLTGASGMGEGGSSHPPRPRWWRPRGARGLAASQGPPGGGLQGVLAGGAAGACRHPRSLQPPPGACRPHWDSGNERLPQY